MTSMPPAAPPATSNLPEASHTTTFAGRLRKWLLLEPGELLPLATACGLTFFAFSCWYILRPIRNAIASEQKLNSELPAIVTATLITILIASSIFAYLSSKLPRRLILPAAYQCFALTVFGFYLLFEAPLSPEFKSWVGKAFFVWASVFNLLAVSTAWSVLADAFRPDQAKRLFGRISIGATIGAMNGAAITGYLTDHLRSQNQLFLVSIAFLQVAALLGWLVARQGRSAERASDHSKAADRGSLGGSIYDGFRALATNRYVQLIACYMFLYTVTSTFLWLEQTRIMSVIFSDRASRSAFNGKLDLIVNSIVLVTQLLASAHVTRALGIGRTLLVTPLVTIVGFLPLIGDQWLGPVILALAPETLLAGTAVLALTPLVLLQTQGALMAALIPRSSLHYAIDRPSRETLYSMLEPADRYKTKNLVDTFIYRGGDTLATWIGALLPAGVWIPIVGLGAAGLFSGVGWLLGRRFDSAEAERPMRSLSRE